MSAGSRALIRRRTPSRWRAKWSDFDENTWVQPKDRPHVSRAVPLALAAVRGSAWRMRASNPKAMTRDELRRIGVIVGSGGGSQEFTEEQYRLYYTGHQKQCSVYTIPTGTIGTLASEVSMRFGFRGMSHIVSTGCTSSTDAIGYAYRNIQAGVIDTMVTGGVDAPIAPLILRGFMLMRIMTTSWNAEPQRASRPFSRDRDGFVLGEGAWFFVLEDRERALARGAHIYGEIAGYASTCEALPPRASGRMRRRAGAHHRHGPGRGRRAARGRAVHQLSRHRHRVERPYRNARHQAGLRRARLQVAGSSVKSLIGHPQGACGAAGIATTLLAMRDGIAPGTKNVEEPDPECDLDYISAGARKMDIEYAVANCIAFGSKNSAIILRHI